MRVLLLTPVPVYLSTPLIAAGDYYIVSMNEPDKWPEDIDFVVSFGYRHILSREVIEHLRGRLINIHMSLLPWNRGCDPNFWSWFDGTPKGVSIHAIDEGVDTGDILAQKEITDLNTLETLRSSYSKLTHVASDLFATEWPRLRRMDWDPIHPSIGGTYHRAGETDQWFNKLTHGWDTPVWEVEILGGSSRGN